MATVALLVSSCGTQKYLKGDEVLLEKFRVHVESEQPGKVKNSLKYELESLVQQVPNDRAFMFFKPRLYFYYRQQNKRDTSDFDRFVQSKLTEPPALYDEQSTEVSRQAMQDHLYRKGYLQARVRASDSTYNKKVTVDYFAQPKQLFIMDSLEVIYPDPELAAIVADAGGRSHLRQGKAFSLQNLNAEKQRILNALQNDGYIDFSYSNFDLLEVLDTTDARVTARLRVRESIDQRLEPRYIGSVTVYNRFEEENPLILVGDEIVLDSVRFVNFNVTGTVRPSSLLRYIGFRPGDKLSRSNINRSRSRLQLPAIKFANPRLVPRADSSRIVDVEIDLIHEKKINVETSYQVSQNWISNSDLGLFGLTGSINTRNNNFLGGSELLSNDIIGSIELALENRIFNAVNFNFNNALSFPRFVDYLGIYRKLSRLGILGLERYNRIRNTGNVLLNANYEYVDLFRFYRYQSIDIDFGFRSTSSTLTTRRQLQITHPSVTYFSPRTRESFNELYGVETFARRSFEPQFFTSLLFNELVYAVEQSANIRGVSSAFITQLELSGLEAMTINAIVNDLTEPLTINGLSFAQFVRLDLDGRIYKQLNTDQSLAFRANVGIALPFGTSDFVPYVRQFFLGGPNSIRAWRIRELGPGSHQDRSILPSDNLPFFQAADLKLLLNAEYRFDVFWRLEGAFFIDAGNIWTLQEDERDGGQFSGKFIDEIAVGSGLGIRIDADYFKVVLDIGLKVRNPFGDENGRHLAWGQPDIPTGELINLNFAINYPF